MTESDWLTATDPLEMLLFLRNSGKASERKLRLFAASCCRRIWHLLGDERSRRAVRSAVELAERYADDPALAGEFARLDDTADGRGGGVYVPYLGRRDAYQAAGGVSRWLAITVIGRSKPMSYTDPAWLAERAAHAGYLRCILGNPFAAPPRIDPAWLAWDGGTIPRLAEAAYQERALPSGELDRARLAVLADALEEAGCDDAALLGHLRGPGPCVRGCHDVDLLTGREAPP